MCNKEHKKTNKGFVPKRVTSYDVARFAGVSQSSVSRVFNPNTNRILKEETRKKVLEAAQKLNYNPNVIARSLTSKRTDIIGIVMRNTTSDFYSDILIQFIHRLQKTGRRTLVFTVDKEDEMDDIIFKMLQYQVDSLIVSSVNISKEIVDKCFGHGTPVFLFNTCIPDNRVSAVWCNKFEAGKKVANILLNAGHKHFAYISGKGNAFNDVERENGFIDCLKTRGITKWLVEQGDYSYESGCRAIKRLLKCSNPPDAVFCTNDMMALGALDVCRFELGIRIPEDISIIGFDDVPAASWPTYSLTTIRQPVIDMVDTVINLLEKTLENSQIQPSLQQFDCEIIKRGSARLK